MGSKAKIDTKTTTVQQPEELLLSPIKSLLADDKILSDAKEKIKKTFLQLTSRKYNSGIPSPNILKKYNDYVKNGAERVLDIIDKQIAIAEKQSENRMELETLTTINQLKQTKIGQAFGLVIAILILGSAVLLGLEGHNTVASILGGLDILGLVAVFIYWLSKDKPNFLETNFDDQNEGYKGNGQKADD